MLDEVGLIPHERARTRGEKTSCEKNCSSPIADRGFINMGDLPQCPCQKNNLKLRDLAGVGRVLPRRSPRLKLYLVRPIAGSWRKGSIDAAQSMRHYPQRMGSLSSRRRTFRKKRSPVTRSRYLYGSAYLAIEFFVCLVHLITDKPREVAQSDRSHRNEESFGNRKRVMLPGLRDSAGTVEPGVEAGTATRTDGGV